jgi:hypothetical protein
MKHPKPLDVLFLLALFLLLAFAGPATRKDWRSLGRTVTAAQEAPRDY